MFEEVTFLSENNELCGRLYAQASPAPSIVMAHGTSCTITMGLDAYAAAFHSAGFQVLIYDHANFGISGGEPRYEINPWVQGQGYRDAVTFLRREKGAGTIALWGVSYSAMIVLVVAAFIPDIAAIVAQVPACGVCLPGVSPSDDVFFQLHALFEDGDVVGGPGVTTGPLPVVSDDQIKNPSLLVPIGAYHWFMAYGGRQGSNWCNQASRVIPATAVPFSPYLTAPYLKAPLLMMIGRGDEMVHCNPHVQRAVFDKVPTPKEFHELEGGHFGGLWQPSRHFDEAVNRQIVFLKQHLF